VTPPMFLQQDVQHPPSTISICTTSAGKTLLCRSSCQKHTLTKSLRFTKWYATSFTKLSLFTSCCTSSQHRSLHADSYARQTQACPLDGKSATRIPRTFPTTSTNHRSSPGGNHRQEPTPRSSRPIWLSTTARLKSDPRLRD
jgi:hypothetical protein